LLSVKSGFILFIKELSVFCTINTLRKVDLLCPFRRVRMPFRRLLSAGVFFKFWSGIFFPPFTTDLAHFALESR
jgi:hypothetical protein